MEMRNTASAGESAPVDSVRCNAPDSAAGRPSANARRDHARHYFVTAVLLLAYVLQCAWFERTQSITFDESIHTAVAQAVWREHRFDQWMETPPLGHLLLGLPIHGEEFQMKIQNPEGWLRVTALAPGPERFIRGPRVVNIALGVVLGILLWCATRELFSLTAANFALGLFAFSPQFIAHFSVATVDGIAVLTVFAVAFQLVRWRNNPSWSNTLLLGVSLGLALLAKFYAPPFVVLALLAMLLPGGQRAKANIGSDAFSGPLQAWKWKHALTTVAVAAVMVWAGYFFHVGEAIVRDGRVIIAYPRAHTTIVAGWLPFNLNVRIPAPEFFAGFHELLLHNQWGHPSFVFGRVYLHTPPYWYFPVAIALKWPTITLVLATAGIILFVLSPRLRSRPGTAIAAGIYGAFGAAALSLTLWARIGIGDRHALTLYPFLLIFAAACWQWAYGLSRGKRGIALAALLALAMLNAADALRYAPGYLSYFNVFIPPEKGGEFLTDSSLDWGQGLLALREYQREHPTVPIHLAYFGSVDPSVYGIRFKPLGSGERTTGTVVVSATMLSGQYLSDPQAYHWLLQFKPVAILDHCMFVFEVPQAQSP